MVEPANTVGIPVIYLKNKKKSEVPLLRGRSSTSQSVVHNDNYKNNTTTTHPPPPPHVKTESFKMTKSDPSPPPPPIPVKQNAIPPPPPKPKSGPSPPPPPPLKKTVALSSSVSKPPPAPGGSSSSGEGSNGQVKLKPLHWDKVNPDSDHSMVWDKIDRGSFSFDGDLMEALFGYVAVKKSPDHCGDKKPNSALPTQIFILDPRKSQNTAIVLKSLGMTRDELVKGKNPLHLFVIVRNFLPMVDKVCVEISRNLQRKTTMGSP